MNSQSEKSGNANKSLIQKIVGAIILLAIVYAVAQPKLNEWFDLGLPGLPGAQQEQKLDPNQQTNRDDEPTRKPDDSASESGESALGEMREIRNNVFQSTAGLIYTPGSADGHRMKHVLAHAKDKPSRPIHGVFDVGGEKEVFALLDEAYLLVKKNSPQVHTNKDDGRTGTSYDINMKRRIGYIGGESGGRSRNPAANYVRMVLEDNRVITAFPVRK